MCKEVLGPPGGARSSPTTKVRSPHSFFDSARAVVRKDQLTLTSMPPAHGGLPVASSGRSKKSADSNETPFTSAAPHAASELSYTYQPPPSRRFLH